MIINKPIEVDEHDLCVIRDRIWDIFDLEIDTTNEAGIAKLIFLDEDYNGGSDTMDIDSLVDAICQKFVGLRHPEYRHPEEYRDEFYKKVNENKGKFIAYFSLEFFLLFNIPAWKFASIFGIENVTNALINETSEEEFLKITPTVKFYTNKDDRDVLTITNNAYKEGKFRNLIEITATEAYREFGIDVMEKTFVSGLWEK